MKLLITVGIILVSGLIVGFFWEKKASSKPAQNATPKSFYAIDLHNIDGEPIDFNRFRNNVILIVNVASKCGYTPQYKGLEALHQTYKDKGLIVLGVPCNNFMGQEPGSAEEIKSFCETKYDVSFLLTEKVNVVGQNKHPLYQFLTQQPAFKGRISWNFNKILVGPNGEVIQRFGSNVSPQSPELIQLIESQIAQTNS